MHARTHAPSAPPAWRALAALHCHVAYGPSHLLSTQVEAICIAQELWLAIKLGNQFLHICRPAACLHWTVEAGMCRPRWQLD
jgi:hypothetical protein